MTDPSHAAAPAATPPAEVPARPGPPAPTVTCTSTYRSAARDAFAFEMFLRDVGQYFTVYAREPDAYTHGARYAVTLTPFDPSAQA